jgi:hypothetical protein
MTAPTDGHSLEDDEVLARFLVDSLAEIRARRERALKDALDADPQDMAMIDANWRVLRLIGPAVSGTPARKRLGAAGWKAVVIEPRDTDGPVCVGTQRKLCRHLGWSRSYWEKLEQLAVQGAIKIETMDGLGRNDQPLYALWIIDKKAAFRPGPPGGKVSGVPGKD